MMKLFGYFLIFMSCLTIGVLPFAYSEYSKRKMIIDCSLDQGMKANLPEDEEKFSVYGEAGSLVRPKIGEKLKSGKGTNHSLPNWGEPALLHK